MRRRLPVVAANAGDSIAQLLYCSRKVRVLDAAALAELVEQAARRNAQHRISGTLLAGCGLYLQFLEGPAQELEQLWTQLQRDRRHGKPQLMMKNTHGSARLYPAAPMSLLHPAAPLQFTALMRDVREHVNVHAVWLMSAHEFAQLVDRSARRRERADAAP